MALNYFKRFEVINLIDCKCDYIVNTKHIGQTIIVNNSKNDQQIIIPENFNINYSIQIINQLNSKFNVIIRQSNHDKIFSSNTKTFTNNINIIKLKCNSYVNMIKFIPNIFIYSKSGPKHKIKPNIYIDGMNLTDAPMCDLKIIEYFFGINLCNFEQNNDKLQLIPTDRNPYDNEEYINYNVSFDNQYTNNCFDKYLLHELMDFKPESIEYLEKKSFNIESNPVGFIIDNDNILNIIEVDNKTINYKTDYHIVDIITKLYTKGYISNLYKSTTYSESIDKLVVNCINNNTHDKGIEYENAWPINITDGYLDIENIKKEIDKIIN